MSNTPVYTDNSVSPLERRHHMRRRVSALAYLDIGADNGGIALNLSEEGMAFQAVGPLDSQTGVSLRIQLPDSRTRIKTAAQIVWMSESNRQAGVRFVDMPSEGRTQIQEWVRAQIWPNAPSEGIPRRREVVNEPQGKQENVPVPRKDKWLSMMAKLGEPELANQSPLQIAENPEIRSPAPVKQETAATLSAPGIGLDRLGERVNPLYGALRLRELPPHGAHYQPRTEPPQSCPDGHPNGQNSDYAVNAVPSYHRSDKERVLERSIPISRTVPPAVPKLSTPHIISAEPSESGVDPKTNPAPNVASTFPAIPAATRESSARKWARVAVLFASFSILSFSIGTWVGSLGTRVRSVQIPTLPAVAAPVTKPVASVSKGRKANELTSAIANKTRAEHAGANSQPETLQRKLELPTSSPLVLPLQQNVQSTPTKQSPAPVTAAKSPESRSPLAPVPDDSAVAVPAPRIVAGRILGPTDRFNPCHLTYRVEPTYPLGAQQQRIEGAVKIHLVIGTDGTVRSMKLLNGSPLLAPSAMDAAKFWHYLPALLNGQPVETEQDIEIDFQLPR